MGSKRLFAVMYGSFGVYKRPSHPTVMRRMKNGRKWPVSSCKGNKGRNNQREKGSHKKNNINHKKDVSQCIDNGCRCGCLHHVDEVGDRICWCTTCDLSDEDWQEAWKPIWSNMAKLRLSDKADESNEPLP